MTSAKRSLLTEKERQFISLACDGLRYKQIAKKMFISPRTIDGHRDKVFQKTGAKTVVEAVAFLFREGHIQ